MTQNLRVRYGGEVWHAEPGRPFTIGREGDLVLDTNMHLHRRFLQIDRLADLWWLSNVGTLLPATVTDERGLMQTWLAPGGRVPLVFDRMSIWFTAGTTTYELAVLLGDAPFAPSADDDASGGTTLRSLTPEQRMLLVALAESVLRKDAGGRAQVPSARVVADRLGWSMSKLEQNFEGVCRQLASHGVRGLHIEDGAPADLRRRARVLEYAVSTRLVGPDDLGFLDAERAPYGRANA